MSIIKIPILVEAFRQISEGKLKLEERIEWNDDRRRWGTSILRTFDSGLQPTFRDYLELMITVSDYSAIPSRAWALEVYRYYTYRASN